MPVTKTAKRALRSSRRKEAVNKARIARMEISIRQANKKTSEKTIRKAIGLTDKAAKNKLIHKNKAARIKSRLAKLSSKPRKTSKSSKKAK